MQSFACLSAIGVILSNLTHPKRALKIVFPHFSYAEALTAELNTLQEQRENQCLSLYQSTSRGA